PFSIRIGSGRWGGGGDGALCKRTLSSRPGPARGGPKTAADRAPRRAARGRLRCSGPRGIPSPAVDGFVAFVLARPRWVIACVLAVTALFARELRSLEPRVSLRDVTPRGHAYRAIDEALHESFGVGQTALLAIGVERGDVFTRETLARIERLTRGL